MYEYIDIHSHILPGVDDGAEDMRMSLCMLKIAADNGIRKIILTPHNKPGRHNEDSEHIAMQGARLQRFCEECKLPIQLYPGNELYYRSDLTERIASGKAMTLADSSYLLVEFNPMDDYDYIRNGLYQLLAEGYQVILAHAERYESLQNEEGRAKELIGMGIYIQLNAGSIMGSNGFRTKKFARQLLKDKVVHFIATDSHNDKKRGPYLKDCAKYLQKKYGKDYVKLLLHDNPAHILTNERI